MRSPLLAPLLALSACGPLPRHITVVNLPVVPRVSFGLWNTIEADYEGHRAVLNAPYSNILILDPGSPTQTYCPVSLSVVRAHANTYVLTTQPIDITRGRLPPQPNCALIQGKFTLVMSNPFVGRLYQDTH